MSAPSVLVDATFIDALLDERHEHHAAARDAYASLVDRYERNEIRLRARADHLDPIDTGLRRTVLAPVESISVAGQYRRQATRLRLPPDLTVDDDTAVTLVVLRRERIRSIATYRDVFDVFELTVVG